MEVWRFCQSPRKQKLKINYKTRLCSEMAYRTDKLWENMLHQHGLKLRFIWFSLFQFITQSSNSKKCTVFLSIRLKLNWCRFISKPRKTLVRWLLGNAADFLHTHYRRLGYLLKISTMNNMNFWRFSFPRFLTSSLTKSIAAVLGL